jgi:peptide/nickel transport system substrate-binding protein
MTRPRPLRSLVLLAIGIALVLLGAPATAQTPKYGGVLVTSPLSATPSFSPHEESTIATVQQASPCFNNLIYYDPAKKQESVDTIVPELADRWAWQDNHRNLVFFLRKGVKWHDGRPFTSEDVKYTFDAVRGAPDAKAKLKVNPRKLWYENVEAIEAPDPTTVVFRLKRPQPSLLLMLASGYSPIYPAHVPLAEFKNRSSATPSATRWTPASAGPDRSKDRG